MKKTLSYIMSKLEIVLATVLFFTMLITCGLYIDIKMNGKTSSLPPLSEREKSEILRSVASESISYTDDLIEPVFVGLRTGGEMIACFPEKETRITFENMLYGPLYDVFTGDSYELVPDNAAEEIESIKNSERYLLVSFYDDIPSSVFVPCLSQGYEFTKSDAFYNVKHLFFLPDNEDNLYCAAISSDMKIQILKPGEQIKFNKVLGNSYDINDGYSYFEFFGNEKGSLLPVLTSTFNSPCYSITSLASLYGKEREVKWIDSLLEIFTMNHNLVRSYSAKNGAQTNYIDELYELSVDDDGKVSFEASENEGINLNEYLGYLPENNESYTYYDKIFAVKNLVNSLYFENTEHCFSICGIDYDNGSDVLSIYLKGLVNGVLISNERYDAIFRIRDNRLVYADFPAIKCASSKEYNLVIPQNYASSIYESENVITLCSALEKADIGGNLYKPRWIYVGEGADE